MRISSEMLEKCNTLEDLVEAMVTTKEGVRLNYADIGETKSFISRYKYFKDWLKEEIPNIPLEQILFIMDNQRKVTDAITNWYGYDRLLTVLEFEQRKNKEVKKSRCCGRCDGVHDICITDRVCDTHLEEGCEICYGERL